METKVCRLCGKEKPLCDYYTAPGSRDGYRSECKTCNQAAKRARYAADPQKYIGMVQRWRLANTGEHNAYQRARRARPEVKRSQRDAYYRRTRRPSLSRSVASLRAV